MVNPHLDTCTQRLMKADRRGRLDSPPHRVPDRLCNLSGDTVVKIPSSPPQPNHLVDTHMPTSFTLTTPRSRGIPLGTKSMLEDDLSKLEDSQFGADYGPQFAAGSFPPPSETPRKIFCDPFGAPLSFAILCAPPLAHKCEVLIGVSRSHTLLDSDES